MLWRAPKKGHFRGEDRYFSNLDFIARLTLPLPPKGKHLVRRYGVYSSRARGTWKRRPALASRAADGWYGRETDDLPVEAEAGEEVTVSAKARRKAWARLLANVYETLEAALRNSLYSVVQNTTSRDGLLSGDAHGCAFLARPAGECPLSPSFAMRMRSVSLLPVWKDKAGGLRNRY